MLKTKPIRGALALLLAVSLCLAMNLTAFLIDTPAMREHAEQAVDLLGYESASPEIVGGFASSRLDNYTAVLILKTAAYIGDDPLPRMAFSGLRTDLPPQEDQTDWEAYATYSDAVPSPNNVPYSRYWHGYTFALRLLLCLFTFTNLQMLLLFAQTALLLLTVLLMVRRGLQQLIPAFAVSWFFMSPPALGLCLQYAPVSLIALLACSLLLALKPALSRSVGLPVFFALIGLFVNYFDLLTFPVVSLSFPLILLIALETRTMISFGGLMREALLCCVGWALGYACMWMLKWGLNFLVLGQDGIAAVGDQISLRLSAGGESHSRLDILLRNIRIVTDKTAYRVILLAVLALLLAPPRQPRAAPASPPARARAVDAGALQPRIRPHLFHLPKPVRRFFRASRAPRAARARPTPFPLNPARGNAMTTRELLYIKTIADEKSMTRAAQKLFVTQPSLSHCVMTLEQQLGTRLFTRTAGGLVLTYAGEKYYRMACEVLRVYAAFESEINEERALSQGRVTVGITNYLATAHLPRMLPAFHREHPGIEVRICEETTDQVERSLLSGRLDFAILHTGPDDGLTGNPSLDFEALGRDPFLIAAPHDERLAALAVQRPDAPHPELDPALLGGEPFLMVSPGQRIRQITDRVLAEAGVKPQVLLTSRNYELLRRLTSEGMGCMLLPSRYVGLLGGEGYQPAYYMIPPKYRAWWALSVVRLREAYLSRAAEAFLASFKAHMTEDDL